MKDVVKTGILDAELFKQVPGFILGERESMRLTILV